MLKETKEYNCGHDIPYNDLLSIFAIPIDTNEYHTDMRIPEIRLQNQQLSTPLFRHPKELVSWMGAMQAQDYTMVKWAVGIRLKSPGIQAVEKALHQGEILRTHVMRPTWHLVAAEDIRWMLKLSAQRIKSANDSYAKGHGLEITEQQYERSYTILGNILSGKRSLTKQEIAEHFEHSGLLADNYHMTRFMSRAEVEGIVCSGECRGRQHTYALLDERVPPTPELTKEEALARLATAYFRSHAPATLQDFSWWSGLPLTEARQAISLIEPELMSEQWHSQTWYIHDSCRTLGKATDSLHLLPSYDEYLIGYKDRTNVLPKEDYSKAFTNNGLFFPVLLYKGHVVGNWNRRPRKRNLPGAFAFPERYLPERGIAEPG